MDWISFDDHCPDPFLRVLVTDGKFVILAEWHETKWGHGWRFSSAENYRDFDVITHWMPLPQPPKEKDGRK